MRRPTRFSSTRLNEEEVCQAYFAIKAHFDREGYDIFKYHGGGRFPPLEGRRDRYSYVRLAKKEDPYGLIVAAVYRNPKAWSGEIINADSEEFLTNWLAYEQSINYRFLSDLRRLSDHGDSVHDFFVVEESRPPALIDFVNDGLIDIQTMLQLAAGFKVWDYWRNNVSPILKPNINRLHKLSSFVEQLSAPKIEGALSEAFGV